MKVEVSKKELCEWLNESVKWAVKDIRVLPNGTFEVVMKK